MRKTVSFHTAGALAFDGYGDLAVAVGDNQQTDLGPANTADLRGGILRIHPVLVSTPGEKTRQLIKTR